MPPCCRQESLVGFMQLGKPAAGWRATRLRSFFSVPALSVAGPSSSDAGVW